MSCMKEYVKVNCIGYDLFKGKVKSARRDIVNIRSSQCILTHIQHWNSFNSRARARRNDRQENEYHEQQGEHVKR